MRSYRKLLFLLILILIFKHSSSQTTIPEIFGKGLEYYYGAKFQEAIQHFDEYIQSMPNNIKGYQFRGLCYQGLGNYPRAIEDFTKAIGIAPNNYEAYINRGNTYFLDDNLASSLNDFTDAIKINRNEIEGYIGRSRVYALQEEFPKAINDLITAAGIDPNNARLYINMSWINILADDTTEAFNNISKALSFDSNIVFTNYKRDQLYVKRESYKFALALADQKIQRHPESYLAYFTRGMINFLMNNYEFAIEDYKRSLFFNKNGSKEFVDVMEKILRSIKRNM